jgi:hypothetical protein
MISDATATHSSPHDNHDNHDSHDIYVHTSECNSSQHTTAQLQMSDAREKREVLIT